MSTPGQHSRGFVHALAHVVGAGNRAGVARTEAVAGADRVLRGGSWFDVGGGVRSACRNRNDPANRNENIGFRLAAARECLATARDQTTFVSAALRWQKANALRQAGRQRAERLSERRPLAAAQRAR